MTASETAARKKELSENFTIEELVDMYLDSEQKRKAVEIKNDEQELLICELRTENQRIELKMKQKEIEDLTQNNCFNAAMRRINQMDATIDVLLTKYVQWVVNRSEN